MAVPSDVRKSICSLLWKQADDMDWTCLNNFQKSQQYKNWTQDDKIGGVLSRYMPLGRVHPYIKDSLLKPYAKSKKPEKDDILRLLEMDSQEPVEEYIKPLGVRLKDGKIIVWGRAVDWKIVLLAIFERAKESKRFIAHAAILTESNGKFSSQSYCSIIQEAADLLHINKLLFRK